MDLRQLKYFVALADLGNFHKAAESVGLTQSALTQSIAKLESTLDVDLFIRGKAGTVLTSHGKRLYQHAQVILAQVQAAETELTVRAGGPGLELAIGVVPSLSDAMILELLDRIRVRHIDHRIKVVKDWSSSLIPMLERGVIDYAFVSDHLMADPIPEITREVLFQDQVQVVVGRGHPLFDSQSISLEPLAEHEWVAVSIEPEWPEFLAQVFAAADLVPPRQIIQTNSVTLAIELIGGGHTIGLVSARTLCSASKLEYRFFDVPQLRQQRVFSLCHRTRMVAQPFHQQFVHMFRDIIHREFRDG